MLLVVLTEISVVKSIFSPRKKLQNSFFFFKVIRMTQRDDMGRVVGVGFRTGNSCTPVVDSCQCMAKPIEKKKSGITE